MPYTLNVNGRSTVVDVPADMPLLWSTPGRAEPEGHQIRVRHRPVRRVHGARARPRGARARRRCRLRRTPRLRPSKASRPRARIPCRWCGRRSTCRSAATARLGRSCPPRRCWRRRSPQRRNRSRDERQRVPMRNIPAHSRQVHKAAAMLSTRAPQTARASAAPVTPVAGGPRASENVSGR